MDPSGSRVDSEEEKEGLIPLTKTMKTFLKATFSGTPLNTDRKSEWIRLVSQTAARSAALSYSRWVLKAVLPKDAIKVDGYSARH